MGTFIAPLLIYRALAAVLTIGSIATVIKPVNCSSTTGFIPINAAPTPIPTIPASDIGVSNTLSEPNFFCNPFVAPHNPP